MDEFQIAEQLYKNKENINLIYAFNSTGKTRLSVAYKDYTKEQNDGEHAGVYYNAFSEDLFIWDNDEKNNNEDIKLEIKASNLNDIIKNISDEDVIREKLSPYNPKYNFKLIPIKADDPELGWGAIVFFMENEPDKQIKISRGEERIFVWCFFLALFETEGWADKQNEHFFIDDPVSSLDDNNIFTTAKLILELFEKHCDSKKIILTTHHMGLFSILQDWLSKGENASKFKIKKKQTRTEGDKVVEKELVENKYLIRFLEKEEEGKFKLKGRKKGIVLYHLLLLQVLQEAKDNDKLYTYHFVLLRQILESISSFLGEGRFGYVLSKLNYKEEDIDIIGDINKLPDKINHLSHEKVYTQKLSVMGGDNRELFEVILDRLIDTFHFSIK